MISATSAADGGSKFMLMDSNSCQSSCNHSSSENLFEPSSWQNGVMWLIILLIIILNSTVFIVVPQTASLRNATGYAMLSLAIADTGQGLFGLGRLIFTASNGYNHLYKNERFCDAEGFLAALFAGASIMTLTFLSCDKYIKLNHPLQYHTVVTKGRCIICLLGIWVYVLITVWPFLGVTNWAASKYYKYTFLCMPTWTGNTVYCVTALMLGFTIPFVITLVCHMKILNTAWGFLKRNSRTCRNGNNIIKKELYLVKMLCFITVRFYIAWGPYVATVIIPEIISGHALHPVLDFWAPWLGASNSFWNPVIYFPTLKPFRQFITKIFHYNPIDVVI